MFIICRHAKSKTLYQYQRKMCLRLTALVYTLNVRKKIFKNKTFSCWDWNILVEMG